MHDPVFLIRGGRGREAELRVESLEVSLRGEPDGTTWRQPLQASQRFSHEHPTHSCPPHLGGGYHPPDGSFLVAHTRLEHARIGDELSLIPSVEPAEEVVRVRIPAVCVGIGALLLDDEHSFAESHYGVEIFRPELSKARPLPMEVAKQ